MVDLEEDVINVEDLLNCLKNSGYDTKQAKEFLDKIHTERAKENEVKR